MLFVKRCVLCFVAVCRCLLIVDVCRWRCSCLLLHVNAHKCFGARSCSSLFVRAGWLVGWWLRCVVVAVCCLLVGVVCWSLLFVVCCCALLLVVVRCVLLLCGVCCCLMVLLVVCCFHVRCCLSVNVRCLIAVVCRCCLVIVGVVVSWRYLLVVGVHCLLLVV